MDAKYLVLLSGLCIAAINNASSAQRYELDRPSVLYETASPPQGYSQGVAWQRSLAESSRMYNVVPPPTPATYRPSVFASQQEDQTYAGPRPSYRDLSATTDDAMAFDGSPATGFLVGSASGVKYPHTPISDCNCWFGVVGGLYMTRDNENPYRFSYDDTNESIQLLDTRDASMSFSGGAEARIGRTFCCGQKRVEFVYWGLYPDRESSLLLTADTPGNIRGILNWNDLDYNGVSADNWVDNAVAHRVRREFEIYDFECNLLSGSNNCIQRTAINWVAGFRYFRFGEQLQFASDNTDAIFTGAPNEIYYDVQVGNELFGFQVGGEGSYYLSSRCELAMRAVTGILANRISHHSRIGGDAGTATVNNGPLLNREFDIVSTKTDVAMLAELDASFRYQLCCGWHAAVGYRVLGATGVALPTNQIYADLRGVNDVAEVDSNGSLILHGGYARLELSY